MSANTIERATSALHHVRADHINEVRGIAKSDYVTFQSDIREWAWSHVGLFIGRFELYQSEELQRQLQKGVEVAEVKSKVNAAEQGTYVGLYVIRTMVDQGLIGIDKVVTNHQTHLGPGKRLAIGKDARSDLPYIFEPETVQALSEIPDETALAACAGTIYLSSTHIPMEQYLAESRAKASQ